MKKSNTGVWIAFSIIISTIIVCIFMHYERKNNKIDKEIINNEKTYYETNSNRVSNNEMIKNESETKKTDNGLEEVNSEIPTTTENVEDDVIDKAIEEAESYVKNGKYEEAERVISNANKIVSNNERLKEEVNRLDGLKPVSLMSLDMLSGKPSIYGTTEINTGEVVSGIGVTLTERIDAGQTMWSSVSYATMRKYEKFRGKLALKNDKSKNSPIECYIRIYCDGILSYTSDYLISGSLPIDIEADIRNAEKVEIRYTVHNGNNYYWDPTDWASERYYQISFLLYDAELIPVYE